MKLSLRSRYKQIIAILVVITVLIFPIRNSINTWRAYSYAEGPQPSGLIDASSLDSANPDYYFLIGYYLFEYDYQSSKDTVLSYYKEALKLSPYNHNYWFYLADLYFSEGDKDKSMYALKIATALSPGTVSLRWRAGMLSAKLGDMESVIDNLAPVIKFDRNRQLKAFSLLWQSVGDGERIFNIVSDNALRRYFYYLRNTKRSELAGQVYEKLKGLNYNTDIITTQYTADLISQGEIESARHQWSEKFGGWEGVWNGDFEDDIKHMGFGWKLSNIEGVKLRKDNESYAGNFSLMVDFDGEHNLNFQPLRQVIPVFENTEYTLKFLIKSEDLSSSSDLTWQVRCMDNETLDIESEPISGTNNWYPLSLSFDTPLGCTAIVLKLKRPKSHKLNKYISGTVWIDEVELVKES